MSESAPEMGGSDPFRGDRIRSLLLGSVLMIFQGLLLARLVWPDVVPGPLAPVGAFVSSALVVAYLAVLARRGRVAEHRANHDALTGLPNRTLFEDRLEHALEHARRHGSDLAVLFIDLDGFKKVNDSLGHPVGNRLLQMVARRLEASVRGGETVARFGGDEFTVLLTDIRDASEAAKAAQRLLDAFAEPVLVERHKVMAGLSIGVALWPTDGRDAATLVRNADSAMYVAKQHGRRCYELFSHELNDRVNDRFSLAAALHAAIDGNQLELHYQPKVDLRTGRVVCVEALVRWQHPERGLLAPGEFLPVAEEAGLMGPLGEWVLSEACGQAARWQDAGFGPLRMAVNLSPRQFAGPIDDTVAAVLRNTQLDPRLLELEITEGLALEPGERVHDLLCSLRDMGVRLAVDDFGTGPTALSNIARWPIDLLKIDQTFVHAIDRRAIAGEADNKPSFDTAVVIAVVSLARTLGLEVTAKGVETRDQLHFLRGQGCDLIQGYLFSAAVPAAQMESMLGLGQLIAAQPRDELVRRGA